MVIFGETRAVERMLPPATAILFLILESYHASRRALSLQAEEKSKIVTEECVQVAVEGCLCWRQLVLVRSCLWRNTRVSAHVCMPVPPASQAWTTNKSAFQTIVCRGSFCQQFPDVYTLPPWVNGRTPRTGMLAPLQVALNLARNTGLSSA